MNGLLAAGAAAAIALAGCGSSTSSPAGARVLPAGSLVQAAEVTSAQAGAHVSMHLHITSSGLPDTMEMTAAGVVSFKPLEVTMHMRMSGLPQTAGLPGGSLKTTEIMIGQELYMQMPLLAGRLPGGERWIKLNLASVMGQATGLNYQALTSGNANPDEYLSYLRGVDGPVTVVGHEPVRGVPSTRYRAVLNLSRAAEKLSSTDRAALRAALGRIESQLGTGTIPVEVWVDSQNRVRRMTMSLPIHAAGADAHVQMNVEYFDFGPTPPVSAPGTGEVYEATQSVLEAVKKHGGI